MPLTTILLTDTTASVTGLATASATASGLPTPLDSLGENFTSPTCLHFFNSLLQNQTFQNCLPLSLLLQTSKAFFVDSLSFVRLTQILDASCDVDFNKCSAVMSSLGEQIQSESNCGAEYRLENPVVTQAYNGLITYPILHQVGCLTDSSGRYCFADAVTNVSAPSSSYIYYLPLGVDLPGGSQPACTQCLQETMAVFAAADVVSQPLNKGYKKAAEQVQKVCGPKFVSASLAHTSATIPAPSLTTFASAMTLLSLILSLI